MSGAEVAVKQITDRIDHYSYDLICARFRKDLPSQEIIGNINIYRVGWGNNKLDKFFYPLLALIKAWQLKTKKRYDIIWGIMASYAGLTAMLFNLFTPSAKYFLSLQKGEDKKYFFKYTWFWYPFYRMIYSRADVIQGTSSFHIDRSRKHGYQGKVHIITNGVISNTSHEYSQDELNSLKQRIGFNEQDIILTIKTTAFKRDDEIVDALQALKLLDEKYKIMILSTASNHDNFKNMAQNIGVAHRVKIINYDLNFDLIKYLKISDLFLKISRGARLGTTLMEAMLCQIPIVASDVAGVNDIIIDQHNGLLCCVADTKDIATKIKKVTTDNKLKTALIKEGYSSVERIYDWETVAESIKTIFEKI